MKGKLLFVVGLGVGYVLGTRAGRRRYEQIRSVAQKVWESPAVQKPVHSMQDYAADRVGDLGGAVTESIKRAVSKSGRSDSDESSTTDTTSSSASSSGSNGTSRSAPRRKPSGETGDGAGGQAS
jgi:hypothetical protein